MFFPFSFWDNPFAALNNPTTLIGYWKLDETSTNLRLNSVIQNSGYYLSPLQYDASTPDTVLSRPGKFNNAAYFESQLVEQTTFVDLRYTGEGSGLCIGNDSFTLTCWVKPTGNQAADFDISTAGSIRGWSLIEKTDVINPLPQTLEYRLIIDTNYIPSAWFGGFKEQGTQQLAKVIVSGNTALPNDKFSFLAMQYNKSTQKLTLYEGIDTGIKIFETDTTGAFESNLTKDSYFRIGGTPNSPGNSIIDEVAFWRKPLSRSEVATIWNLGNGLHYPFDARQVSGILNS